MAHDPDGPNEPMNDAESVSLRSRVRDVLLSDWDPHNAARSPAARGTYDTYLAPLIDLLSAGPDEDAVVEFLHDRERESMCFPSLGTARLRPVARKLLSLDVPRQPLPKGGPS